ncbi:MAG: AzlD domain-containing protein [Desulfuromonadales bacterium]|nr:MAG: AzlD domain-containing protein [Desulfuromonadales bacterium]
MKMSEFILLVAGMAVVTYVPRWLPLALLAGRQLPRWLTEWLELIPAAILGALLAPTLFATSEPRQLDFFRPELLAAIPTFLVAMKTRSLAGTVVAGMAAFWLAGTV